MKQNNLLTYPLFYCITGVLLALFHFIRADWWGLAVLGGLIILYAYLAQGEDNADRQEVGDNCYFIGFVYTLVVITWSLVLDADDLVGGGDGGGDLRPLLKTVGIALGTSVIGMIARFTLVHGALSPETRFDRLVEKTAIAAGKLEGITKRMAEDVRIVEVSMQSSAEAMADYARKVEAEAEKVGDELNKAAAGLLDEFGARVAKTLQTELLDDMRRDFGLSVRAYAEAVQKANETFGESLSALDSATNVATANIASVNNALNAMNTRLSGENWEEMRGVLNDFAGQVGKLNETLRGIAEQQDGALGRANQDIERLRNIRESFDGMLQGMRDDIAVAAKIKEDYRREYDKAAKTALEETHALYARLISGAELAIAGMEKLGPLADDLRKIANQMEKGKGGK